MIRPATRVGPPTEMTCERSFLKLAEHLRQEMNIVKQVLKLLVCQAPTAAESGEKVRLADARSLCALLVLDGHADSLEESCCTVGTGSAAHLAEGIDPAQQCGVRHASLGGTKGLEAGVKLNTRVELNDFIATNITSPVSEDAQFVSEDTQFVPLDLGPGTPEAPGRTRSQSLPSSVPNFKAHRPIVRPKHKPSRDESPLAAKQSKRAVAATKPRVDGRQQASQPDTRSVSPPQDAASPVSTPRLRSRSDVRRAGASPLQVPRPLSRGGGNGTGTTAQPASAKGNRGASRDASGCLPRGRFVNAGQDNVAVDGGGLQFFL
eukprot:CAMPEP_0194481790 /NCGR_PEP_ID=MMETSP0253-20130528/4046_1 /TAXON_ID=2966 /ORGANISM="Noctiluca scintillans" /LENGTH=319 /DNA_ID=CAMNT_0039321295 /DNA_START=39 /DNA_END=998 /DNA_ORIENTATION=+